MVEIGTKVIKSGYPGIIAWVYTGELAGMVDVRLDSGLGIVHISELTIITEKELA